MILPKTALFINLNKFFSSLFFSKICIELISPLVCRVISRVLDKTVDRNAHHGDIADIPSPPRERNPSVNLSRWS